MFILILFIPTSIDIPPTHSYNIHMPNKKLPVDGYSKSDYEDSLNALAEKERILAEHPLQGDIVAYGELRREMGDSFSPLVEEEQATIQDFEEQTKDTRDAVDTLRRDLGRQLSNARREATEEDRKREGVKIARELLPRIEEMKKDTEKTLKHVSDLHPAADTLGRAVIAEADAAYQQVAKGPRAGLGEIIIELFVRIRELYRRFKEIVASLLAPDRYGGDKTRGPQGA